MKNKTSWKRITHSFNCIMELLETPPIQLLRPSEFKKITGVSLNAYVGRCHHHTQSITTKRNMPLNEIKHTIWHEIGHVLFRSKPHWWIELYADVMSKHCGYKRYAPKYGKSKSIMPPRTKLLELSVRAGRRLVQRVRKEIIDD